MIPNNFLQPKGGARQPPPSIQTPILNRFGHVHGGDIFVALEVRNGAGDLEDSGIAAGGQTQLFHVAFEEGVAFGIEFAEALDEPARHLGIGKGGNAVEAFDWGAFSLPPPLSPISGTDVSFLFF